MVTYVLIFSLSFINIFLRAFQQKNVIHKRLGLIIPISLMLAVGEMLTPAIFVTNFIGGTTEHIITMIACVGIGGGLGCITSLSVHEWVTKKIYKWHRKKEE